MKKFVCFIMIAAMVLLTACSGENNTGGEIIIKFPSPQVGIDSAAAGIKALVDSFNEKYDGVYEVVLEEIPGTENYINKIKTQIVSGDLPAVVYGVGYNLLDLLLEKDYALDITEYVNNDPAWKNQFNDMCMKVNSRDGRIYASSAESSLVGYFYNKEHFKNAGIDKPAETWEEFMDQLKKLKDSGVTPMTMQTSDSGWVTQFWLGALCATKNDRGLELMRQNQVSDFNTEEMLYAAGVLQEMLMNYTTADAIGGSFDDAANNFLSGKTSIIANGPWMITDMNDPSKTSEGFAEKIGCAAFPGNFAYNAPNQGYIVIKQKDNPELERAAVEFVRFMTSDEAQLTKLSMCSVIPSSPTCDVPENIKEENPLLAEYLEKTMSAQINSDNLQSIMYENAVDEMCVQMTALGNGDVTPEEFCNILTEFSAKNKN